MIKDVLPAYDKAFARSNETRTFLDSIVIDGHEVAWMETVLTFDDDRAYTGRQTVCEHDFTKGVGWKKTKHGPASLGGRESCLYKETAIHLRQLTVRREIERQLEEESGGSLLASMLVLNVPRAIELLIEKAKAGEWFAHDDGPTQYGNYFSVRTLAAVLDTDNSLLWEPLTKLWKARKLTLNWMSVEPYGTPFKMPWSTWAKIEFEGWKGAAKLPTAGATAWHFDIRDPKGKKAYKFTPDLPLMESAEYGPTTADIARAEIHLRELIATIREHRINPPEPSGFGL